MNTSVSLLAMSWSSAYPALKEPPAQKERGCSRSCSNLSRSSRSSRGSKNGRPHLKLMDSVLNWLTFSDERNEKAKLHSKSREQPRIEISKMEGTKRTHHDRA